MPSTASAVAEAKAGLASAKRNSAVAYQVAEFTRWCSCGWMMSWKNRTRISRSFMATLIARPVSRNQNVPAKSAVAQSVPFSVSTTSNRSSAPSADET